jgi:ATP-dependent RNA helicase RhlE
MSSRRPKGAKSAFSAFGLHKNLLRAISEAGFKEPRPIQAKTIPQALDGRDILGLAQTGTGKTAAFALPIIEYFIASKGQNPRALILAPTRELAIQTHAEIEVLAKYTNIRSTTVFGGVSASAQMRALKARPDIVVACPGRLLDLAGSGHVNLDGVEVLVLDEADHMLDMGFLPDIKRIISRLPESRQNLLFSATMPREIRSLTDRMLHKPHVVELAHAIPLETIEHALYPVEQKQKAALLRHLMREENFTSAIVFLRTKHRARKLARDLERAGHSAIALQGNMSQPQRQRAMQGFRDGHYDVLVATDIAARGIDVPKVSHVINFDIPNTPDAYTHRIGRTGRAEESGKACTFVTHEDFPAIKDIERKLKMEIPRIKIRDFKRDPDSGGDTFRRQGRPQKKFSKKPGAGKRRGRSGGYSPRPEAQGRSKKVRESTQSSRPAPSGPGFGAGLKGKAPRRQSSTKGGQGGGAGSPGRRKGGGGQGRRRSGR